MPLKEILPHGGKLINRVAGIDEKPDLEKKALSLRKLNLHQRAISDLEVIATGVFSPLEGFMMEEDYQSVVETMRLKSGLIWPIPITLSATSEMVKDLQENEEIALYNGKQSCLGILHLEQIYQYDKNKEAELVFKTTDTAHPQVANLFRQGDFLLGGKITLINKPKHEVFAQYYFTPEETRSIFREKGWRRIVGFQTRNPIHRAHEFIIKSAMEIVDGLFLNPLVGETKKGDIPAEIRMLCYQTLLKKYFPQDRVVTGVYSASMHYAGPREAVIHALARKNFGCTHFIVGRDHAGVGNYYGTFDAQLIFDQFEPEEIGITPLFFDHSFYCRRCSEMTTVKTCPHAKENHLSFSGTLVRELLGAGELPPPEFTRPEIANILLKAYREGQI